MVHLAHRRVARDPGIVDEDVDGAKVIFDLANPLLAGVEIPDVPFAGIDPGSLRDLARALLVAGVVSDDLHPHLPERYADRFADTARPPGNDRNSSHEV